MSYAVDVDLPSGLEILSSPWTGVSLFSRLVLALQVISVAAGLAPRSRRPLQQEHWFVALLVGPPLLLVLSDISIGLLFSFDAFLHFSFDRFYGWLVKVPVIIGTTLLLQCVLAWQYANGPLRSLPIIGVVFGLLAILGDAVFLLGMIAPR